MINKNLIILIHCLKINKNSMTSKVQPIEFEKNVLLLDFKEDIKLKTSFCGKVFVNIEEYSDFIHFTKQIGPSLLYLTGDIEKKIETLREILPLYHEITFLAIQEYSFHYENTECPRIHLGEVPLLAEGGIGLMCNQLFAQENPSYYEMIHKEHIFQELTESNKPNSAYRKGMYLTEVDAEDGTFALLRCSTNLRGPTQNIRLFDMEIINKVQAVVDNYFTYSTRLNHVLAQVYLNTTHKKARIKEHSDKTKDMDKNGVIAFCTFYDKPLLKEEYATKLKFRLKNPMKYPNLVPAINITLLNNSVFIIPLVTNRLYTHEISPSIYPSDMIPTRIGYVIRCSNQMGRYMDGQMHLKSPLGEWIPMRRPTEKDVERLKALYYEENMSDETVEYEDGQHFSLNEGDYENPLL